MVLFPCWLLPSLPLLGLEAVVTVEAVVVIESVLSPGHTTVQQTCQPSCILILANNWIASYQLQLLHWVQTFLHCFLHWSSHEAYTHQQFEVDWWWSLQLVVLVHVLCLVPSKLFQPRSSEWSERTLVFCWCMQHPPVDAKVTETVTASLSNQRGELTSIWMCKALYSTVTATAVILRGTV